MYKKDSTTSFRKHFLAVRVMEHWNRLPREVAEFFLRSGSGDLLPSLKILEIFKAAWIWSWAVCCRCLSRGIGPDDLEGPSSLNHSVKIQPSLDKATAIVWFDSLVIGVFPLSVLSHCDQNLPSALVISTVGRNEQPLDQKPWMFCEAL